MKLTKIEQETVINFNEAEATASVYTHSKALRRRLEKLGVAMAVEEEAVSLLARRGSSREYGARPLRRAIASLVEDPAADLMLAGRLKKGDTLQVSAQGDEVTVRLV